MTAERCHSEWLQSVLPLKSIFNTDDENNELQILPITANSYFQFLCIPFQSFSLYG